jgi:hypothetical protein
LNQHPVPAIDGLKIYSDDSNFTATASTTSWIIANNYVVTDVASGGYADGGVYKACLQPQQRQTGLWHIYHSLISQILLLHLP